MPNGGGNGIAVLPEGLPMNACSMDPVCPYPATCPESLIPDIVKFANPLGAGMTETSYVVEANPAAAINENTRVFGSIISFRGGSISKSDGRTAFMACIRKRL
jgi:hypothetical protein